MKENTNPLIAVAVLATHIALEQISAVTTDCETSEPCSPALLG